MWSHMSQVNLIFIFQQLLNYSLYTGKGYFMENNILTTTAHVCSKTIHHKHHQHFTETVTEWVDNLTVDRKIGGFKSNLRG